MEVVKFGGSSVKDAAAIQQVLNIVKPYKSNLVVVLSAMGGMTDLLLKAAGDATKGQAVEEAISQFRSRHLVAIDALIKDQSTQKDLKDLVEETTNELKEICASLATLKEATPSIMDRTASRGERLMGTLFAAALAESGVKSQFVDATKVIRVQKQAGAMGPDLQESTRLIQTHLKPIAESAIAIVPGWIGGDADGKLVTMGRGGSDLSASVIGHALKAKSVTLFKEVDGLMTADPRMVKEARVIPELHYREATELAYYGAKILHSRTIIPLLQDNITLTIRNTFDPQKPGTRIAGDVKPGAFPVKALTAITDQAIIAVEGKGMMGVPGIAARTFQALAQCDTSVSVISQASSEASICFVVPQADAKDAKAAIEETFALELQLGIIDRIAVMEGQAVIAIVGLGMKGTPGIASRSFQALARSGVNIEAIAQGSSELNISTVISQNQVAEALRGLHREFRLEKLRVSPDPKPGTFPYFIYGFGQIGRELIRQINAQEAYFSDKMQLELSCVGLSDSSGCMVRTAGISPKELADILLYKENGEKLANLFETSNLDAAMSQLPHGTMFIDLTAADSEPDLQKALQAGLPVALANKKPIASSQESFDAMQSYSVKHGVPLRYEATVGAGLPILDTITKLAEAGDEVLSIQGCLSGTLGFLMTELQDGSSFADAVHKAYRLGYTEPDPREDLSGMDVGRKALILARTLGITVEMSSLGVESLFEEAHSDDDPQKFLENIKAQNQAWAKRIAKAKDNGQVLRYIASVSHEKVSVGIEAVDIDSPLGRLRGTDNQVTIRTRRYDENPLIVVGPGAGAAVTAAGVLNDMLAIATR